MATRGLLAAALFVLVGSGCANDGSVSLSEPPNERQPCTDHNPLRNVYFGDLHIHTSFSFDAYVFDVRNGPEDAYRFARGEPLTLSPLDAQGRGTQVTQLERPLDFAAVTDHSEFLGEVDACLTPGSAAFDSESCKTFRAGGAAAQTTFGIATTNPSPSRLEDVCGADGQTCLAHASTVWRRMLDAAEAAYDRSENCTFTTFAAYEYTANTNLSTLHRNVIFRTIDAPFPVSYIEQPTPQGLWNALRATCRAEVGCEALAIPHNSNESNGKMFLAEYPGTSSLEEMRAQAEIRATAEPLVEVYQHKGDSECMNGLSGVLGEPDELCEFEKRRRAPVEDCREGTGVGGVSNTGCVSSRDFVRGALLVGLQEAERIGVNPFRLGVVASTDTHNGTPGATDEQGFLGHRGATDDEVEDRLGPETRRSGPSFSPGGLTAVWAEESSRERIFAALRRREVYGTSGPRITLRFFGGWGLDDRLCDDPDMIAVADRNGVPMGTILGERPPGVEAPTFFVSALRDPGGQGRPGALLQRIQIIKGWVERGEAHQQVFDVAGDGMNGAAVDVGTCVASGPGFNTLCATWTDPDFNPAQRAFYYARVLENPTCRWNAYQCNALPLEERPASCSDPQVPKVIQERAWSSPIWYDP